MRSDVTTTPALSRKLLPDLGAVATGARHPTEPGSTIQRLSS